MVVLFERGVSVQTRGGEDGKGGGEVAELFAVKPPNLTNLAARADGKFPFSDVFHVIILGMEAPGHGPSEMPI
ncbi:hypothetical protein [Aliiruegeria lutimaris]|uniref:hypothetical protein n=1 Tax=Aliiruegeria lutimaris TaxID=571298 RepID=UPI000B829EF4|nr:hypothetical protein [Aliiruegeria lutimaris]